MSKFWNVKATANNTAEVTLYGTISDANWYGDEVTPKQFEAAIKALGDVSDITVRINSGGGGVFAGVTIYNILKNHKAKITTRVDGLAASIASIIAMAGDKIIMGTGAMMMVHNPWTVAIGEAKDFRKMADDLDKIRGSLLDIYHLRTGSNKQEITKLMDDETWMSAQEAISSGFADEMDSGLQVSAAIIGKTAVFNGIAADISRYSNSKATAALNRSVPSPGSTAMAEQRRIAELENMRMAVNSHIIDAAIADGRTAGEAAIESVKAGLYDPEQVFIKESAMTAENAIDTRRITRHTQHNANAATEDEKAQEHADGIIAEIKRLQQNKR